MPASITQEWKAGTPAPGWRDILRQEFASPYMKDLIRFLDEDRLQHTIYPAPAHIFRAFTLTDFADVKVVILGQDPYHGPQQANGLAFSVFPGVDVPPSLANIHKEIATDIGHVESRDGNLDNWATQGVFLLNTVLTVRAAQANSHRGKGWENFTGRTIEALGQREDPLVFLLWGRNAMVHESRINADRHLVLKAPHPSPLSAHSGFFGCRHFSKGNDFLAAHGKAAIRW
jgi:uracil-DNA glycosylase